MPATTPARANTALVRKSLDELVNRKHYDVLEETHASDFVHHDAPGTEGDLDRDALEAHFRELHEAFPDLTSTIEAIVSEGDLVATRLTYTGTHEGEYLGVPATGTKASVGSMYFSRIEDGKIAEGWDEVDTLGLMRQLGVIESPTE